MLQLIPVKLLKLPLNKNEIFGKKLALQFIYESIIWVGRSNVDLSDHFFFQSFYSVDSESISKK